MARVQRSTAARSDSAEESPAGPSTGLFTAVDKEPDIVESPAKLFRKKKLLRTAARPRAGEGVAGECRNGNASVTRGQSSKASESRSSGISEVAGSTRDQSWREAN